MDELAQRLKDDAERIDAAVSAQLDARIAASLAGVTQESPRAPRRTKRPPVFWWASSLTGLAAALAVIVVLNLRPGEPGITATPSPMAAIDLPAVPWKAETAVLTAPLEKEYEDLQSDLKKAEAALKDELEAIF